MRRAFAAFGIAGIVAGGLAFSACTPKESCDAARWAVASSGDTVPTGVIFECPVDTGYGDLDGVFVPSTPAVIRISQDAINRGQEWLNHVVAHETCHARAYKGLENFNWQSEAGAEFCAGAYGFPHPS